MFVLAQCTGRGVTPSPFLDRWRRPELVPVLVDLEHCDADGSMVEVRTSSERDGGGREPQGGMVERAKRPRGGSATAARDGQKLKVEGQATERCIGGGNGTASESNRKGISCQRTAEESSYRRFHARSAFLARRCAGDRRPCCWRPLPATCPTRGAWPVVSRGNGPCLCVRASACVCATQCTLPIMTGSVICLRFSNSSRILTPAAATRVSPTRTWSAQARHGGRERRTAAAMVRANEHGLRGQRTRCSTRRSSKGRGSQGLLGASIIAWNSSSASPPPQHALRRRHHEALVTLLLLLLLRAQTSSALIPPSRSPPPSFSPTLSLLRRPPHPLHPLHILFILSIVLHPLHPSLHSVVAPSSSPSLSLSLFFPLLSPLTSQRVLVSLKRRPPRAQQRAVRAKHGSARHLWIAQAPHKLLYKFDP